MMVRKKRRWLLPLIVGLFLLLLTAVLLVLSHWNLLPTKSYTAEDFDIETAVSPVDFNGNGVDDYRDLLLGARQDAENHPVYDGRYYNEAYPPDDIGVCTDVVWRAFRNAGYCLRDMVDLDIALRPEAYPHITHRDDHIDFRRVRNLRIFFETYAICLTTDPSQIDQWQPGDIVVFGDNQHIGIVSDRRTRDGTVYIIHNGEQPNREEDYLSRTNLEILGHYRFDASLVEPDFLIAWQEE